VTACGRIVQCGHLLSIVLFPVTVLMPEYVVAQQGMDVALEEGAEGLDGELDELVEV
jgi:hypothetical protein